MWWPMGCVVVGLTVSAVCCAIERAALPEWRGGAAEDLNEVLRSHGWVLAHSAIFLGVVAA